MSFSIERHPPERGRSTIAVACGTCCCCCCLHSIGGLIGAVTARPSDPEQLSEHTLARNTYWNTVLVLLGISALSVITEGGNAAVLLLLIVFPAVQLVASLVAAVVLFFRSGTRTELRQALTSLARITLRGLAGAVLGTIVMLILFRVF